MQPARFGIMLLVALPALAGSLSCRNPANPRPAPEPPAGELHPTRIEYVDTPAFDTFLESALTNQDPVVHIQTPNQKPDWEARLNAWLAAWNKAGQLRRERDERRFRLQSPLPKVVVDGDSIREFRLLIEGVMGRVETLAREGSAWWAEEQVQRRRVELLRPYNLRFHQDDRQHIQIIFFHERYASQYRDFMQSLTEGGAEESEEWVRGFSCSQCKKARAVGDAGKSSALPGVIRSGRE